MISEKAQQEIRALQAQHPDKQVMLIAEKGTMGRFIQNVWREQCCVVDRKAS